MWTLLSGWREPAFWEASYIWRRVHNSGDGDRRSRVSFFACTVSWYTVTCIPGLRWTPYHIRRLLPENLRRSCFLNFIRNSQCFTNARKFDYHPMSLSLLGSHARWLFISLSRTQNHFASFLVIDSPWHMLRVMRSSMFAVVWMPAYDFVCLVLFALVV